MNLRVLKKKSKQARPFIEKYYRLHAHEVFAAERGENYHGLVISCKHKPSTQYSACSENANANTTR